MESEEAAALRECFEKLKNLDVKDLAGQFHGYEFSIKKIEPVETDSNQIAE